MGRVRNFLSKVQVSKVSDKWTDMFSFEICEDFHIHWRNLRIQLDKEEWILFCQRAVQAWEKYVSLGKPIPNPNQTLPTYLANGKIKSVCGIGPDSFRIEDDDLNGKSIHIHLRFIRLDLSHEEFLKMADEFTAAASKLREIKS
jgi:hypothetical protein